MFVAALTAERQAPISNSDTNFSFTKENSVMKCSVTDLLRFWLTFFFGGRKTKITTKDFQILL